MVSSAKGMSVPWERSPALMLCLPPRVRRAGAGYKTSASIFSHGRQCAGLAAKQAGQFRRSPSSHAADVIVAAVGIRHTQGALRIVAPLAVHQETIIDRKSVV